MLNLFKKKPSHFVSVIIPAAGASSRMGGIDKLFYEIDDIPIIVHTLMAFEGCRRITEIILVVPDELIPEYMRLVTDFNITKVSVITKGGDTRQKSVALGLVHVSAHCEFICIHDGARPFVSNQVIADCIEGAIASGAATAAVAVKDTIKRADAEGAVAATIPREDLYLIQTPQVFSLALYEDVLGRADRDYTDDCQLVEAVGGKVSLTRGSYLNMKVTTPEDLLIAEGIYDRWEG